MLIFISDLHLTDRGRPPFSCEGMLTRLRNAIQEAQDRGADRIVLVLLGDIFEMLRSPTWIAAQVRPWEDSTDKHTTAVDKIFTDIQANNKTFFEGLVALQTGPEKLEICYIPGNHDRVLNESMGRLARSRLKEALTLSGGGERFKDMFIDDEHAVLAYHGHHLDKWNRLRGGRFAAGDVVVVEVLAGLKQELIKRLPVSEEQLSFIDAIGHVESASPWPDADWLLSNIANLPGDPEIVSGELDQAAKAVVRAFGQHVRGTEFEGWEWARWWKGLLSTGAFWAANKVPLNLRLKALPKEPDLKSDYAKLAERELRRRNAGRQRFRFVICGHTHHAHQSALRSVTSDAVYLNTGTWCRLYKRVGDSFSTSRIEAMVLIRSAVEQASGLPPYSLVQVREGDA